MQWLQILKRTLAATALAAVTWQAGPARAQVLPDAPVPSQPPTSLDDLQRQLRALEGRYEGLETRIEQGGQAPQVSFSTPGPAERQDVDAQLDIRVPSYQALPADQVQALENEFDFSDKLKNFVYIHGYLRSGFGSNGKGGDQEYFLAPGAAAKYRLGNETDTYGELSFEKSGSPKPGGPLFRGNVMIAFVTNQNASFDPGNDQFALRQAYVEASNFAGVPEWRFWAGERYYRRHDIHINDFYFLDMSGYGGGVEEICFGPGKLALAYLGGSTEEFVVEQGRIAKHNLDMRLYDVPVPLGTGIFWADLAATPGGGYSGDDASAGTIYGYALGFIHVIPDFIGGMNKLSVQWGRGAAANFTTSLQNPSPTVEASSQFLFTETITTQPADWFTMQATTITRVTDDGSEANSRTIWVSGGLRPIYNFTEYFSLAFEYGADWVDNEPEQAKGTLHKFTLAPQLATGNHFYSRPVIRTFVTYAVWPESLRGKVGGDAYALSTEGWSMGCQLEAWW